jgi:D-alanyl-D-alanine carboxypeptidase (penicillin-binding protein 5/6)
MVILIGLVIFLLAAAAVGSYARPVPQLESATQPLPTNLAGDPLPARLPWPEAGSAAIAVDGLGVVGEHNGGIGYPLASLTKVMVALVILDNHPLAPGEQGSQLRVAFEDAREFLTLAIDDQSVVPVQESDILSQRQLLEGLLIPSGNNYANFLARWDAGSIEAFVARMNAKAAALGMTQTHYADASGISPLSVSTANDQLILAQAAMRHPVFAEIVRMQETSLPYAGVMRNTNRLLSESANRVVGIKTGETDEAGGCFMIAVEREVDGQRIQTVGVVLGQESLGEAFRVSERLASTVADSVQPVVVLPQGARVGELRAAWGESTDLVTMQELRVVGWPGMPVNVTQDMPSVNSPLAPGTEVGTIAAGQNTVQVQAVGAIGSPDRVWRVFR